MGFFPFSTTGKSLAAAGNAAAARSALSLGTLSTQDAASVNITGGSVSGLNSYAAYDLAATVADYTVLAADVGTAFQISSSTGAVTLTLPAFADVLPGDWFDFKFASGGNPVTLDGNGTEPIEGGLTYAMTLGESVRLAANADKSAWIFV